MKKERFPLKIVEVQTQIYAQLMIKLIMIVGQMVDKNSANAQRDAGERGRQRMSKRNGIANTQFTCDLCNAVYLISIVILSKMHLHSSIIIRFSLSK